MHILIGKVVIEFMINNSVYFIKSVTNFLDESYLTSNSTLLTNYKPSLTNFLICCTYYTKKFYNFVERHSFPSYLLPRFKDMRPDFMGESNFVYQKALIRTFHTSF